MAKSDEGQAANRAGSGASGLDRGRFEEVLEAYQSRVYNLVRRILMDDEAAAQVTREVLVQLFRSRRWLDAGPRVPLWVYGMATNLALERARERKEVQRGLEHLGQRSQGWSLKNWWDRLTRRTVGLGDGDAEPAPLRTRVYAALRHLSDSVRVLVCLRDVLGLSYPEIAQLLERDVDEVRDGVREGREALREVLRRTSP
jgi:RNA polymerase sigma-70 factor (ECF subfamily)